MSNRSTQDLGGAPLKNYFIGFALSLVLTLAAYFFVTQRLLSGWVLNVSIAAMGLVQAWIQILFFLNMRKEPRPHWNFVVFIFMITVAVLVVFGSLWIMYHLNYNMMPHAKLH